VHRTILAPRINTLLGSNSYDFSSQKPFTDNRLVTLCNAQKPLDFDS